MHPLSATEGSMSIRLPSPISVVYYSPHSIPTGEASLSRVSPQYVVLNPPSALLLEVMASGAFEALSWHYYGTGGAQFSLSNFGRTLTVDSTVLEHAGQYVARLQGTSLLEVVFQVQPFSEMKCFVHADGIDDLAFTCIRQQQLSTVHEMK